MKPIRMDSETFVFPDELDRLTRERLGIEPVPHDYFRDTEAYIPRISNISFKKPGQMIFYLDGRKSQMCQLTAQEMAWLDVGDVSFLQMAAHYAALRWTHFSRKPVQMTLFN